MRDSFLIINFEIKWQLRIKVELRWELTLRMMSAERDFARSKE
jgi:hypothetical protein